jgi:hypothetical protein
MRETSDFEMPFESQRLHQIIDLHGRVSDVLRPSPPAPLFRHHDSIRLLATHAVATTRLT